MATLFLLDLHQSIASLPFRVIVPDSAVQSLREYVRGQTAPKPAAGYIAVRNDQLVLQEQSPEQHENWLRRLREFIRALVDRCEIVGGKARLGLPTEVRQQLPEAVGYAVTDAVAIAKVRNLPVWTDDLLTAALIAHHWACGESGRSRFCWKSNAGLRAARFTSTRSWGSSFCTGINSHACTVKQSSTSCR